MTCLSCIDLATLHKTRLEEQLQYKLSSWSVTYSNNKNKNNNNNNSNTNNKNRNRNNNNITNVNNNDKIHDDFKLKQNQKNNNYNDHDHEHEILYDDQNVNNNDTNINFVTTSNHHTYNNNNNNNNDNNVNDINDKSNKKQKYSTNNNDEEINFKNFNYKSNDNLNNKNQNSKLICDNNNYSCNNNNDKSNRNINNNNNEFDLIDDFYNLNLSPIIKRGRSGTWPRTRSLNAPSPYQHFGPCGRIMKNSAMVMQIQDPASQRLTWYKPPLTVLVIKKVRDSTVLPPFVELVVWLVQEKHMVVWVESACLEDPLLQQDQKFQSIKEKLVTFKDGRDDLTDRIDFIVCLGGDGTLLYASLLFQQSVPPVMAFHLGSLGFLTPFQFDNFREQVTNVLEGHAALTLRSRLRCILHRKSDRASISVSGTDNNTKTCTSGNSPSIKKPAVNILVLNEVVIDRGPSPYLSNIDLYLDDKLITSVQGDGLIVSTPTGSTAYAVAAGASMIHPSVPAIMVTPICPHSLSFRPIVVPAGVELKISISPDSRNTAWVSFDGRNRQELFHGDCLKVTMSIYPVPSICAQDQISDWFDSLAECLHWNVRKRQRLLDELSDLTASGSEDTLDELEKSEHILDS